MRWLHLVPIAVASIAGATSLARADIPPSNDPACEQREAEAPCVTYAGAPGRCKSRTNAGGTILACEALRGSETAGSGATPGPAAAGSSGCSTTRAPALPLLALGVAAGALALAGARSRRPR